VYIAAGSTSPLVVNGTLTVYAENLLNMAEHDLTVSNTVTINAGGGISVGDGGTLTMQGAFANSGSLNIGAGTATVAGTYSSTDTAALLIVGGTFVNSVAWTRDADFAPVGTASTSRAIVDMRGAIHLEGGLLEITNNTVVMRAHADRVFSSGIMRVGVGFTAVEAGSFPQTSGTLELVGANNSVLEVSGGNTVYNLTIDKSGSYSAYLQSNLIVNGNLTLLSGGIVANSYTISLGGNWANSSGALAFNPGTGTVIFGKSGGTQTVTGSTGFYNLTENHTGTLLQFNSTVSINNILELTNGANFLAAATIATLNNNPAASEVKFNGSYTSTINSYNSGGILRALTLAHVDILDITDNGIYGSYEANSGTLELHQDAAQWIDINGFITVTNNGRFDVYGGSLDAYFTYATNSGITMDSGQINFWNKGIMIYNSAYTFSCNITGGVIRTAAGFWNYRANFTPGGGSVEFIGSLDGQISMAAGSYFKDLIINKPSALRDETEQLPEFSIAHDGSPIPLTRSQTASLSSAIEVRGNLTIQAGILASNSNNISLYGYWTNDVGAAAFTEGTGYVRFIGSNTLTGINSSDTFYNLALVNTSASYNNVKIAANKTVTVLNNLVIQDGTLNMQNSSSLSVGNDFLISSGAGLNANNATGVNISVIRHFSDANASYNDTQGFYPGTSTLTFTGAGISSVSTTETSFDTGNLTISKGAGGEVHFSKPVKVSGNCSLSSGLWADDANGFTHEFRGNLSIGASGSFYTTNQNTLAFKGGIAQTLTNSGAGVIYGLTVDKTAGTALNLGSNILGLNGGSVLVNAGILNLGSYFYRSTGNLTVNNTGKISVGADGSLEVANTKSLTVNTGGILELLGSAGHNARLTHQSGYYGLNLETGATLSAEYATFEYMDGFGVNIKSGALVDATHSLHNCTFQLGAVSGTLLTVNNTQIFSVNNANFPTNTWSGTYNVAKTLSQGSITFNSVSGNFAGAAYENDAFSRINWPAAALPELEITSASVNYTTRYVCDVITYSISIRNNSAYAINTPFNVALYYHSAGVPGSTVTPDQTHTFASLAAGATASWTFSTTSSTVVTTWNSYFRVDAGNTVAESNETNNTLGGFTINWQALPAVTAPTITYNEPTNQVVLHWTYPTTVSNYKVFRSTNPEGPFTSVIATPSTNTYSEAATGTKYFYRITAVKNWP
jgi:hypothetical protein